MRVLDSKFAAVSAALLSALVLALPAASQTQPQAIYLLQTDLLDATSTYGPVSLLGTPPPAPPANGVCVNGTYLFSNGQDVRTPVIGSFDATDFQLDFEFSLAALPTFNSPVLMGGMGWRWIGLYVQPSGIVGLKYNNSLFTWSQTTLTVGPWYAATIKFEGGVVELFINGAMVHTATIGTLNTNNNFNFTTNDFSNGTSHNGCIRNLIIANDTTLGPIAVALPFGTGCDGLTLTANGAPTLGNAAFELLVGNVPPLVPLAFVAFGSSAVDPGTDLTGIGMAGCFGYTSLDLGLFGPTPVVGTTANFPLPIPNDPSLTGASIAAQGVSFSSLTALGLAASNGMRLVLAP